MKTKDNEGVAVECKKAFGCDALLRGRKSTDRRTVIASVILSGNGSVPLSFP